MFQFVITDHDKTKFIEEDYLNNNNNCLRLKVVVIRVRLKAGTIKSLRRSYLNSLSCYHNIGLSAGWSNGRGDEKGYSAHESFSRF